MTISLGLMQANLTSTCLHESSARWDGLLMSVWRDIEGSEPPLFFAASNPSSTYVAPPALSIPSCLIVSLAELYRRNPAVPGHSSI